MSMLRFGWVLAIAFVLAASGCGGDDRDGGDDAGPGGTDSGPGVDSGPGTDSGPGVDSGPGTDAGGASGMCPEGMCDLLTNDGCMAGQACQFLLPNAEATEPEPLCVEAGTGGDGATCTDYTECQEGYLCDTEAGVCRHYCCGDSDAGCPTGQTCAVALGDSGVGLCRLPDSCDPLTQTGCPEGQGCYLGDSDGSVICIASTMNLGPGEACTYTNDCAPGSICTGPEGDSFCREWCDTTADPTTCPEGFSCASFGISSTPEWGACVPSM